METKEREQIADNGGRIAKEPFVTKEEAALIHDVFMQALLPGKVAELVVSIKRKCKEFVEVR